VPALVVEFTAGTQSLIALREASYRLIGQASCQIDEGDGRYICRITPNEKLKVSDDALRSRFLDLVTDQNLRESIAAQTQPMRDLLVALAFGALAEADQQKAT
jgi:His-Xaa-Ser system protein HxsD